MKKRFAVIDYNPDIVDQLESRDIDFMYGDMTDPEFLEEAGAFQAKLIVSVVTDFESNKLLLAAIEKNNPTCTFICHADSHHQAAELYERGAGYVILPHYIGSEKLGAFLKKNGLSKSEFKKYRTRHIESLATYLKEPS